MLPRRIVFGANDDRNASLLAANLAPRAAKFLRDQRLGQQTIYEWLLTDPDLGSRVSGWQRSLLSGPLHDLQDRYHNYELSAVANELCKVARDLWGVGLRAALVAIAPRPSVTVTSQRFDEEQSVAISYSFDFFRLTSAFVELTLEDPIDIPLLGGLMGESIYNEVSLDMLRVSCIRFYAAQERLANGYGWLYRPSNRARTFFSRGFGGSRSVSIAHLFVLGHEIAHYVIRAYLECSDFAGRAHVGEELATQSGDEEIVADILAHQLVTAYMRNSELATSAMMLALCSAHVFGTAVYGRLPASHPYPAQRLQHILGQDRLARPANINPERLIFLSTATSFIPPVNQKTWRTIRRACEAAYSGLGPLPRRPSTSHRSPTPCSGFGDC